MNVAPTSLITVSEAEMADRQLRCSAAVRTGDPRERKATGAVREIARPSFREISVAELFTLRSTVVEVTIASTMSRLAGARASIGTVKHPVVSRA